MRWLLGLGLGGLVACLPPDSEEPSSDSTTHPMSPTTGLATSDDGTTGPGSPPRATFGMDGIGDDGSEVGFVAPVDLACEGGAPGYCAVCDVRAQECVRGFRCVAWAEDDGDAWNGTKCIGTALAPVDEGEPCTVVDHPTSGRDDCPTGSMCWDVDPETLQGRCVPFCGPRDARVECPAGTQCMEDSVGVLALCLPPCDPLALDSCAAGETCRYLPVSQAAFCIPDQGGQVLSPTIQCGDDDEPCAADQVCISGTNYGGCGSQRCCTAWCDVEAPDADAQCDAQRAGQVCVPVFDEPPRPATLASLGFCAAP